MQVCSCTSAHVGPISTVYVCVFIYDIHNIYINIYI